MSAHAAAGADGGGREFPIPMRGNELAFRRAVRDGPLSFPIPMRGNEMCRWCHPRSDVSRFPIPMRGNETALVDDVLPRSVVSDPHEG